MKLGAIDNFAIAYIVLPVHNIPTVKYLLKRLTDSNKQKEGD